MKKRVLKKFMALMCVTMLGVTGVGTTCFAASGGMTASCSKTLMAGTYTYSSPGHQLKIEIYGYETSASGESIVKKTEIANGNYTSVSAVGKPDSGYRFTKMSAFGAVDGNLDAAKLNVMAS